MTMMMMEMMMMMTTTTLLHLLDMRLFLEGLRCFQLYSLKQVVKIILSIRINLCEGKGSTRTCMLLVVLLFCFVVLCCVLLCCVVLCCVLCCAEPSRAVLCCAVLCCAVLRCLVLFLPLMLKTNSSRQLITSLALSLVIK